MSLTVQVLQHAHDLAQHAPDSLDLEAVRVQFELPAHQQMDQVRGALLAAQQGVFDKVNSLSNEAKTTLRNVGVAAAIATFLVGAWRAKGAVAGVLVAALAAALFVWLLNNVDKPGVQDPFNEEVNSEGNSLGPPAEELPPAWSGLLLLRGHS